MWALSVSLTSHSMSHWVHIWACHFNFDLIPRGMMAARFAKLNRRGADLGNQLIDVQGSFNTHVNIMGETPTTHKKKKETFEANWTVVILTAVDISKSALQWKTVTWVSEGASAGDKSSRDGPETWGGWWSERGRGGWVGVARRWEEMESADSQASERLLWLAAADLGDDGFSPEASNEGWLPGNSEGAKG